MQDEAAGPAGREGALNGRYCGLAGDFNLALCLSDPPTLWEKIRNRALHRAGGLYAERPPQDTGMASRSSENGPELLSPVECLASGSEAGPG